MTGRGFLIRFIDIGLIILFGFLMISDIENLSQVELASAVGDVEEATGTERLFLSIEISAEGFFSMVDPVAGTILADSVLRVSDLEARLRGAARKHGGAGRELVVLIHPDEHSVLQRTVDVMDVCDRIGVRKSLHADVWDEMPEQRMSGLES